MNWATNYGCDQHDFIKETGATLKYAIKHKGWTNNIDDYYIGPIDGTHTTSAIPDCLFNFGLDKLQRNDMLKLSKCGYWIQEQRRRTPDHRFLILDPGCLETVLTNTSFQIKKVVVKILS